MKRKSSKLKKSKVKKSKSRKNNSLKRKIKSYSTTGIVLGIGIPVIIGLSGLGYYYKNKNTYKSGDIRKLLNKIFVSKINGKNIDNKIYSEIENKYYQLQNEYLDGNYNIIFVNNRDNSEITSVLLKNTNMGVVKDYLAYYFYDYYKDKKDKNVELQFPVFVLYHEKNKYKDDEKISDIKVNDNIIFHVKLS